MDLDLFEKFVTSSPAIVVVLTAAVVALWRRNEQKDALHLALHRETLTAMSEVSKSQMALVEAVRDLRAAIEDRR